MTQAVVLGGTGHIGAAIARALDQQGLSVTATGRRSVAPPNLMGTDVAYAAGDDRTPGQLAAWVRDADIIVDAATPYPVWRYGADPKTVVAAARRRSRDVVELTSKQGARLVHVSSFTTLPAQGGLKESLRLAWVRGVHPYFEVKEKVEADVLAALSDGLKGTVINPTACFGPYDMKPAKQAFIPMLMQGEVMGSVRHPLNVVDVRDVAACVCALLQAVDGPARLPVSGHNIHVDALMAQVCAIADLTAPTLRAPLLPTATASYLAETAAALRGRKPTWPSLPMLLTLAGGSRKMSAQQRALGVTLTPLDQTLEDAVAWYRQIAQD
ncbi:MAG: NAD-dependent epimerase/dehydratase family protein [Pseudomonadota bacterium]